ncbi:MAG: tRNA (N6-isopentenyl adenosine(37)-C2)-methylthiotransferase MiaB [Bdellovibrionota bacterium]
MTANLPGKDSVPGGQTADASSAPAGRLYVKTFGCQMNEYDTEKVRTLLATGYREVSTPEDADVVFVNTCSVREKGEHKLFSLLGRLRELKEQKPELVVGVGGCVAQQEGRGILKRNPAVDFVVGTHNLSLVPALVQSAYDGRGPQVAVDYREDWETLPEAHEDAPGFGRVRGLIAIQRGCNKRCAFCVVPTTRGPEVSRDPQEIIREAKLKARLGARELLLLGQTVNSYGRDLTPRYPFERLIRELAAIDGIARIRFISPHPAEVRQEFLELYGDVPQLVPHIHLPLQSGSDRILKLMNRNYRMRRFFEIVDTVRARSPEIALTTDVIVGFPTETESDFAQTLEALERVGFTSAYSFQYSRRPNTEAEKFPAADEVPEQEARERLLRLQALQEEISRGILSRFLGCAVEVLVEEPPPRLSSKICGRIPQNTPIELRTSADLPDPKPGELVWAEVDRVTPNGLGGVLRARNVGAAVNP